MLDLMAAICVGALCAVVVGTLVGLSALSVRAKLAVFAAAATWVAISMTLAALGWLAPGALGPVAGTLLLFTAILAVLFGGWWFVPEFRNAVLSVPLPALVAVHGARLGGVFFLLFYMDGRISAPFAPAAGGGDMVAAAFALPLAGALAAGVSVRPIWLKAWNAFGALDLLVAVTLGGLSMPRTVFRVFTEEPGTLAMTTLPFALVPAMLVPIFLFVHFVIAARLRTTADVARLAVA